MALIVIRLHPVEPIGGADFTPYLDGLEIEAFDLSTASPLEGVSLGVATYRAPVDPPPTDPFRPNQNSDIVQHWGPTEEPPPEPLPVPDVFKAVATAVIRIPSGTGPEHGSPDLRLVIRRNGSTIVHRQLYFNVPVDPQQNRPPRRNYPDIPTSSVYLALPAPGTGLDTDDYVEVPADGTPPRFTDLRNAVQAVLDADPGSAAPLPITELTPLQARHVAYEIVWNQSFRPLPAPKVRFGGSQASRELDWLYTLPDSGREQGDEVSRATFEGDLDSYYAVGNADSERLAPFVYALAAALRAEALSRAASRAGLLMPVSLARAPGGARFKSVRVVLASAVPLADPPAPLEPVFAVPAEYFYALGAALPTSISAEQRFQLHTLQEEDTLRSALQAALDSGVITAPAGTGIAQAARRLRALGAVQGSAPQFALNGADPIRANVRSLVEAWLAYQGEDIDGFWAGVTDPGRLAGHLELVLLVLAGGHGPLIGAIKTGLGAASADDIDDRPAADWQALFAGPDAADLLPDFTRPGSVAERVAAFIRHVQQFFAIVQESAPIFEEPQGGPPRLPRPPGDLITAFITTFPSGDFEFGEEWTDERAAAVRAHIAATLPDDEAAGERLWQALTTLNELSLLTGAAGAAGTPPPPWTTERAFSIMEALYARGFTGRARIAESAREDFRAALTGTVAWEHADTLYERAGGLPDEPSPNGGTPDGGEFRPVNPDGRLVNCVPPPHRSPLGPVAYLHDLLRLTEDSTCEDPFGDEPEREAAATLAELLAGRRGRLGELAASRAALEIPVPVIDLVNECLEAAVDGPPGSGGVVYDTHAASLGGHSLAEHDPATLFAALPEHSTPATPVRRPGAYEKLKIDFSAPSLPYAQALDINRTYLAHLRTSRYAVMRRFRADITEQALDPADQPPDFQRHLWRYPVKRELAAEYLHLSPEELELLFTRDVPEQDPEGRLVLHELYGFDADTVGETHWTEIVVRLPEFLERTGLTWCEFLELWRSGFVRFARSGGEGPRRFPDCEPCDPHAYHIRFQDPSSPVDALRRLAVFIRLWRKLQGVANARYDFARLRDLCVAFELFRPDGMINPDFVRDLAAFQILRDDFGAALTDPLDPPAPAATGPDRTHLLALWAGPGAAKRAWALDELLDQVAAHGRDRHGRAPRGPEFLKLLADNLGPLSLLAGFDPDPASGDRWDARPAHTLRFAEVLAKIYASDFGVGEVLLLCTADPHLDGDDPFPLQPGNEALDDPLALPDDQSAHSLWALRACLTAAEDQVGGEDAAAWTWDRIEQTLRDRFGYGPPVSGPDPLRRLGTRFFPAAVAAAGVPVAPGDRQYRQPLAPTSAPMWNTPPGPFRYDTAVHELWAELPLSGEAVIAKLGRIRQLSAVEQRAVRQLYFAPRADLAPFAFVVGDLREAEERLIEEPDEDARWAWFQRRFALFYRRCELIAEHLAAHVDDWSGRATTEGSELAWSVLRELSADENAGTEPWERDGGEPPSTLWPDRPSAGAFAALLGLAGTGLPGEYTAEGRGLVWREARGPLSVFGTGENAGNSPIPTVVPALDLAPTAVEREFVDFRNGFATANVDGRPLGGAEGYTVRWTGTLLIEAGGPYEFRAGAPTPDGLPPDFAAATGRWLVTLRRGQRRWVVLSHDWPDETVPGDRADPLRLARGAYRLSVEFVQPRPAHRDAEDLTPAVGGFQLKYAGHDTCDDLMAIPHSQLFGERKDGTLAADVQGVDGTARQYLERHYTSSLRDIRRTYQRAFTALLSAHRFGLSARPIADDGQSEIGYLLTHPDLFAGTSSYRAGGMPSGPFTSHRAWFAPDLLPLLDHYQAPSPARDQRAEPSARRRQALFDQWERIFDYTAVRRATASAPEPPLWLLFHEAAEDHPDVSAQLQRHLHVDLRHLPQALTYAGHTVTGADLRDERWTVRVWHADRWFDRLREDFLIEDVRTARPDLWAADDPGAGTGDGSGNAVLTRFVRDGCLENGEPRRYTDVQALNDGLRLRGRAALLAHLGQDPPALQELLLIDVDAGLRQRATRIEEAVSAVQTFVQRARLGLEPALPVPAGFALLWDRRYATYRIWERCVRRRLYRENWIDWEELGEARRGEAFRLVEDELRRTSLTSPVPGGLLHWPADRPPAHPGLTALQAREPAVLRRVDLDRHGFDLQGMPERHARLSWLAAAGLPARHRTLAGDASAASDATDATDAAIADGTGTPERPLPWWVQAATRMGVRFVRVAAAGEPPASTEFVPHREGCEPACCRDCGEPHAATVDEYYFWLLDARFHKAVTQVADDGHGRMPAPTDPAGPARAADPDGKVPWSWHDAGVLPRLLQWPSDPAVHLAWSRVHNGEFSQPRRSSEPLRVHAPEPDLEFAGRSDDSLRFTVEGGQAPEGYPSAPEPGFRYDLADDAATPLPLLHETPPPPTYPGGLTTFPYFAFHAPGAPILPPSVHAPAIAVAASLRAHCRFEAALRWYDLAFAPLRSDTSWLRHHALGDGADHDVATLRDRAILLNYLETLDEWGSALLRGNTPESSQQARLVFETVARVLGQAPPTVLADDPHGPPHPVADFVPDPAPLNPRLLAIYERNADRLGLVHATLNADRLRRDQRPYWSDPAPGESTQPCLDDLDWCAPDSCYRFAYLIQKAHELAAELRNLGNALLGAYEKGDAEYLATLRATHERQLSDLTLQIRQNQWREADWNAQAQRKAKEIAQTRQRYHNLLIENGLSNREDEHVFLVYAALALRATGNIAEAIAQGIGATPDIFAGVAGFGGSPLFYQQIPIGSKLASVFATAARIANSLGELSTTTGGLRLTQAGWERREEEWRHQVEVLGLEIQQAERHILAAERRQDIALRELNTHRRQMESSAEVHDYLRDKFTAHQLYLFLQRETAALYAQTYDLALHVARQAERAFNYERGHTRSFITGEVWDGLHEGLQAGDRLAVALKRMEHAYLDDNRREYEITKHLSLRLLFPLEFLTLQATGSCEIEIPEWLFDQDYPGHYMRRIRNVSLSVPCVVGPYVGVQSRLTLLGSTTRVDPRLVDPPGACCPDGRPGAGGYDPVPDDPRIVTRHTASEAIATSAGQNDHGMFELNFRDDRYLPFEFAGAAGRWRIELPPENNHFDVATLADVVLHLNYTAREGGDELRRAASESARRHLPGSGVRYFDVEHDLPDAWRRPRAHEIRPALGRTMFPFLQGRRDPRVTRIGLFLEVPGAAPSTHHTVEFERSPGCGTAARPVDVHCVASADWPQLFCGVLELPEPVVLGSTPETLGVFRLPPGLEQVCRVHLLCWYDVV
ncbi:neuraminidase-like domain-containing protein [Actinomadura rugatobispora]|uniref:Neuraminidase-like domain-containing protein n=1 Tax=Actinomadura rugatobispora TaxID=1994 RepID=A0ABW1ABG0_9ACTN|nr:hypothetical protein GCM10010200_092050 [Actinomadura rugatobispora]